MKTFRPIFKLIFKNKFIAKSFLKSVINLNNITYSVAGSFSQYLEVDGLHPKHRLTKYHDWYGSQLVDNWNLIDIGCGNGALANDLSEYCKSIFCIDMNQNNINRANKLYGQNTKLTFLCGDATNYPFSKRFDAIILSNVLEHIQNRNDFLNNLSSLSNVLLLRVPMVTRDWLTLYKKELGLRYMLDITHTIEYTDDTLASELFSANWKIVSKVVNFGETWAVCKFGN